MKNKKLIKNTALIMLETQSFDSVIDWVIQQKIDPDGYLLGVINKFK